MKVLKLRSILYVVLLGVLFGVMSCSKMNDMHQEYLDRGESIYLGKLDSVIVYPGNERLKLKCIVNADPKISELKVAWNNGEDQLIVPYTRKHASVDTIEVNLESIPEGIYLFNFTTHDKEGNSSVTTELTAEVYGENFISKLLNKSIQQVAQEEDGLGLKITWKANNQAINVKVKYINNAGDEKIIITEEGEETVINDWKTGSTLKYQTSFKPHVNSLDLFFAQEESVTLPEDFYVPKGAFSLVGLPMDIPRIDPTVPEAEKDWLHAWDGNNGTVKVFLERNNAKPAFITLDLGMKVQLTKYILRGFSPYPVITPKKYQIWGIGDDKAISEAATTVDIHDISSLSAEDQADPAKVATKKAENFESWKADMTQKGWTLLLDDDRDSSENGGYTQDIANANGVRYVRLVFIDNFHDTNPDIGLSEITFKGKFPTE